MIWNAWKHVKTYENKSNSQLCCSPAHNFAHLDELAACLSSCKHAFLSQGGSVGEPGHHKKQASLTHTKTNKSVWPNDRLALWLFSKNTDQNAYLHDFTWFIQQNSEHSIFSESAAESLASHSQLLQALLPKLVKDALRQIVNSGASWMKGCFVGYLTMNDVCLPDFFKALRSWHVLVR